MSTDTNTNTNTNTDKMNQIIFDSLKESLKGLDKEKLYKFLPFTMLQDRIDVDDSYMGVLDKDLEGFEEEIKSALENMQQIAARAILQHLANEEESKGEE